VEKVGKVVHHLEEKSLLFKVVLMVEMEEKVEMFTLLVDSNTDTLSFYKGKKVFKADKGQPGMGKT
jgi:hypothetical protein